MKNLISSCLLLAFSLVSFVSCNKNSSNAKRDLNDPELVSINLDGKYFIGEIKIITEGDYVHFLISEDSENVSKDIYIIKPIAYTLPEESLEKAQIFFFNGIALINSLQSDFRCIFRVDNSTADHIFENLPKQYSSEANVIKATGIGLIQNFHIPLDRFSDGSKVFKEIGDYAPRSNLSKKALELYKKGASTCTADADCADGKICIDNYCLPRCLLAGGVGATQCAGSGEVLSVSVQCEVSCGSGYYACCGDIKGPPFCSCIPV